MFDPERVRDAARVVAGGMLIAWGMFCVTMAIQDLVDFVRRWYRTWRRWRRRQQRNGR